MKKVIVTRKIEAEVAEYYCDVTGKKLSPDWGPDANLIIHCGYGSSRDGTEYLLHLSDEGLAKVIAAIRGILPPESNMVDFARDYMDRGAPSRFPEDDNEKNRREDQG